MDCLPRKSEAVFLHTIYGLSLVSRNFLIISYNLLAIVFFFVCFPRVWGGGVSRGGGLGGTLVLR